MHFHRRLDLWVVLIQAGVRGGSLRKLLSDLREAEMDTTKYFICR